MSVETELANSTADMCDDYIAADMLRDLAAERDRIAEHRDSLKDQLRVLREYMDVMTDQNGYLVSAEAFDEVCSERDALSAQLRAALELPEGHFAKWKELLVNEMQGSYDTDGITHVDSGDPLIYLQSAIAIIEDFEVGE